ncbi:MAG: serine/threonine-protein phosphatase [Clostridia bacterium]|jgi:protein phosphatase|nr:serine/threonine-protein phosphatase [Clostridia bacterium]MBQ1933505.1 serine/threonine-protein phosphatase [Clostridia bacterium]MBR0327408.1 serine/threonine-protein phosphatase [Clostridia bacterium]
MVIYGTTDKGIKRSANQDSFFAAEIFSGLALVAVCDGMGGAAGGSEASELAARVFADKCRKFAEQNYNSELKCFTVSADAIGAAMSDAARAANAAVFTEAAKNEKLRGMGTTLAAAFVTSDILYGINVGDSRVYLCTRDNGLRRLSKDHSFVQYLVDMGEISELEAKYNSQRNIITRAIGIAADVEPDTFVAIAENSRVILCSDGLTAHLDDSAMEKILSDFTISAKDVCNTFITLANQAGGTDNITAVAVDTSASNAERVDA